MIASKLHIYNLSDERVVPLWQENPYFQLFFGEASLQWKQPCAASDLVYVRKQARQRRYPHPLSTAAWPEAYQGQRSPDTTFEEQNITYSTDSTLYKKVIDRCNTLAQRAGVKLRQSYWYVV